MKATWKKMVCQSPLIKAYNKDSLVFMTDLVDDLNGLMTLVAKGDHTAFRTLATQMGGRMFGLAYRIMNNSASAAEDVVQESLIKLWVGAPNWRPGGSVAAYILTITHHAAIDALRQQKTTTQLSPELPIDAPSSEKSLIERDAKTAIAQGLSRLPDRQRQAVLLSYFGDHSNRHIGATLKITESAVESLLARARRTLARELSTLRERPEEQS